MNEEPIREFRPLVVPAQFFVWGPVLGGLLSLLFSCITVVPFYAISNLIAGRGQGAPWPLAVAGYTLLAVIAVWFLICLAGVGVNVFWVPRVTLYRIFPDRIEYRKGLWNRTWRTIPFGQVIDVELDEGILQRTRGAGTVKLVMQRLVSSDSGQLANLRVTLNNVPQPGEVYELIRSLALRPTEAEPGAAVVTMNVKPTSE